MSLIHQQRNDDCVRYDRKITCVGVNLIKKSFVTPAIYCVGIRCWSPERTGETCLLW